MVNRRIPIPVLFPRRRGLVEGRKSREDASDVLHFIAIRRGEERQRLRHDANQVHEGGFCGDGVAGQEAPAVVFGLLLEDLGEEARAEGDEMVAVVIVVGDAVFVLGVVEQLTGVQGHAGWPQSAPLGTVPGEVFGNGGEQMDVLLPDERPDAPEFLDFPWGHGPEEQVPHLIDGELAMPGSRSAFEETWVENTILHARLRFDPFAGTEDVAVSLETA